MAEKSDRIKSIVVQFYDTIKNRYPVKKVFLYGSNARGDALPDSDIDVGVVVDLPDHTRRVEITADLFHCARKIDNTIEPKCIFWDEYRHPENSSILAEIIRTGIDIPQITS